MKNKNLALSLMLILSCSYLIAQNPILMLRPVKSLYTKREATADALDVAFLSSIKKLFNVDTFVETLDLTSLHS